MSHGNVTRKCHMEMPCGNVAWKYHVEMSRGNVTWKCHVEVPHIHEIQTWWLPHDISAPSGDSLALCDRNTEHNVAKGRPWAGGTARLRAVPTVGSAGICPLG